MHLDAIGHRDAFEYMVSIADTNAPLTERTIRELHTLVLMGDAANRGLYWGLPVIIRGGAGSMSENKETKPLGRPMKGVRIWLMKRKCC